MSPLAVRGKAHPNDEAGAYKQALGRLYAVAYTLDMLHRSDYRVEGFFVHRSKAFGWAALGEVDYPAKRPPFAMLPAAGIDTRGGREHSMEKNT